MTDQEIIGVFADALDLADRLLERAYGIDIPAEWGDAYADCAKARASADCGPLPDELIGMSQVYSSIAKEMLDLARRVRAMTKAENIHARGIAKGGGFSETTSRDDVDMAHADLYAAWPASRLDRLIAAISRPIDEEVTQEDNERAADYCRDELGWLPNRTLAMREGLNTGHPIVQLRRGQDQPGALGSRADQAHHLGSYRRLRDQEARHGRRIRHRSGRNPLAHGASTSTVPGRLFQDHQ